MKKIKLLLALVLGMAWGTAQAQSFSYGIVGGLNLTKLKYSGSAKDNFSSDNRAGWYIGPKVEFNTALGIGIEAALEFSQRSLNITSDDASNLTNDVYGVQPSQSVTEKYRTIEIPINIRYNIGLGSKAGIYVSTGPQFGFALQNMKWKNLGSGTNFSKQNMNTTWNIGAGVRLLSHLEVGIGYNFALGKAGKAIIGEKYSGTNQDYELKYKTNTFQVQVAYLF